jgi:hypothetical protein
VAASVAILRIIVGGTIASSPPTILPPASVRSSLTSLRASSPAAVVAVLSRSLVVHRVDHGDDAVAELAEYWPAGVDWVVRPDLARREFPLIRVGIENTNVSFP